MAPMSPGTTKAGLCQEQDASTSARLPPRRLAEKS
jgi:hypothetical protein